MQAYFVVYRVLQSLCLIETTFTYLQRGVITRVYDGDTLTFMPDDKNEAHWKIRLAEIDAPESDQPCGKESAQFVKVSNFSQRRALMCLLKLRMLGLIQGIASA